MVDRQDIDALLISALYSELTPAEEARLQTHLDSHPADRTALADLTFARNAVRESRILTVQLEPPQAVSAMLLQEAARRAPKPVVVPEKEKDGWFQRFVRSFVAHPAMAAAAMLVVVLGVAGTLYVRSDRSQFAERTAQPELAQGVADGKDQLARESDQLRAQAGSAYEATLDDKAADPSVAEAGDVKGGKSDAKLAAPAVKKPARRPGDTYITVPKAPAQPMDLENESTRNRLDFSKEKGSVAAKQDAPADRGVGGEASGRRFGGSPPPQAAPKPDPAPTTATASPEPTKRNAAPGLTPPPSAPAPGNAGADERQEAKKAEEANSRDANGEDVTWAREVHNKVVVAVKANNCREATNLAVALEGRAPGYYQQNVQNDRQLKQCVAYINAEREREAERVQRARAQQRRNADEAPKAAKPTGSSR